MTLHEASNSKVSSTVGVESEGTVVVVEKEEMEVEVMA
jgi:hypothetical protein